MLLIIVGVIVGAAFGSTFLGDQGWVTGSILGALAGIILQQMQKIGTLESAVKNLLEMQAKTSQQITLLKNNLQGNFQTDLGNAAQKTAIDQDTSTHSTSTHSIKN